MGYLEALKAAHKAAPPPPWSTGNTRYFRDEPRYQIVGPGGETQSLLLELASPKVLALTYLLRNAAPELIALLEALDALEGSYAVQPAGWVAIKTEGWMGLQSAMRALYSKVSQDPREVVK